MEEDIQWVDRRKAEEEEEEGEEEEEEEEDEKIREYTKGPYGDG